MKSNVLLLLSAASAVQIPLMNAPEKRLISTEDNKREWMTEEQIFALYKSRTRFIDVTEGDWDELENLRVQASKPFPTEPGHYNDTMEYIDSIDGARMESFLTDFSSFRTRYYKSKWGKESSEWLFEQVSKLKEKTTGMTRLSVEKFEHSWGQSSIIARYESMSKMGSDIVILSAHQDSVNMWNPWFGRSPGADDDGSGTTTILEALTVLIEKGFVPSRPLEFHFYSAEEGGLLGSQKVVSKYVKDGIDVYAVFHNDMTGYQPKGKEPIIGISTDNVDESLTDCLRMISDTYSGLGRADTKCGYACSDHASWTKAGIPSTFTFESKFEDSSPFIHTTGDSISNVSFEHMKAFVRNVIGFAVELSLFK